MDIKILDKATIDKIAAGEVVERPSNAVKELMENSIDARANAISVEINDGGRELIRVTDNGLGISKDQVRTAFLRHSTSKINSAEDLSFVTTLGFRGEALSSISAVADVEICTKTAGSPSGVIYKINCGNEESLSEAGLPQGTTIIVKNIFKNIPARYKFLQSAGAEAGAVSETVEKIALSHPEIAIKYTNGGRLRLNTSGNGSLKDVIYAAFGREIASNLIEINKSCGDFITVRGYVGDPAIQRSTRAFENFFVNGRYVKSRVLSGALESAFKGYQMKGSFPFAVLNIGIEPELMDVNVHPSKLEVKFLSEEAVYNALSRAVGEVIRARENIPFLGISRKGAEDEAKDKANDNSAGDINNAPEPFEYERKSALASALLESSGGAYGEKFGENERNSGVCGEQQSFTDERFLSEEAKHRHKIIGEIFETYWIVEFDDNMYLIDQHAAHEKVMFERFMKKIKSENYPSQLISPSRVVTLSQAEEMCLLEYIEEFRKLGFDIEHFGKSDYIIKAVPSDLYGLNDGNLFISFLDELSLCYSKNDPEMLYDRIATAACKAAVKGGQNLSCDEARALINELLSLENPYNCPHGRPTMITTSKLELDKKFKRII